MKRIGEDFYKDISCLKSLAQFYQRTGDTQANLKLMQKLSRGSAEDKQASLVVASIMNQWFL